MLCWYVEYLSKETGLWHPVVPTETFYDYRQAVYRPARLNCEMGDDPRALTDWAEALASNWCSDMRVMCYDAYTGLSETWMFVRPAIPLGHWEIRDDHFYARDATARDARSEHYRCRRDMRKKQSHVRAATRYGVYKDYRTLLRKGRLAISQCGSPAHALQLIHGRRYSSIVLPVVVADKLYDSCIYMFRDVAALYHTTIPETAITSPINLPGERQAVAPVPAEIPHVRRHRRVRVG
jgi:hypothetical protein